MADDRQHPNQAPPTARTRGSHGHHGRGGTGGGGNGAGRRRERHEKLRLNKPKRAPPAPPPMSPGSTAGTTSTASTTSTTKQQPQQLQKAALPQRGDHGAGKQSQRTGNKQAPSPFSHSNPFNPFAQDMDAEEPLKPRATKGCRADDQFNTEVAFDTAGADGDAAANRGGNASADATRSGSCCASSYGRASSADDSWLEEAARMFSCSSASTPSARSSNGRISYNGASQDCPTTTTTTTTTTAAMAMEATTAIKTTASQSGSAVLPTRPSPSQALSTLQHHQQAQSRSTGATASSPAAVERPGDQAATDHHAHDRRVGSANGHSNSGSSGASTGTSSSPSRRASPAQDAASSAQRHQPRVLIRDGKPVVMHAAIDNLTMEQRLQVLLAVKDGVLSQDEALTLAKEIEDAVLANDSTRVQELLRKTRPPMITSKDIVIPTDGPDNAGPQATSTSQVQEDIDAECLAMLSNSQRLKLLQSVASGEMTMTQALAAAQTQIEAAKWLHDVTVSTTPPSRRRSFLRHLSLSSTKRPQQQPRPQRRRSAESQRHLRTAVSEPAVRFDLDDRTVGVIRIPPTKDGHRIRGDGCSHAPGADDGDGGDGDSANDDNNDSEDDDDDDFGLTQLPSFDSEEEDFAAGIEVTPIASKRP
ncbi:hypothetical protein PTSG_04525 [Salpingoeca rosetta]|uniref:Uncharacterized protein n=1 Tax=Salpingoeca rosetta (strain ATCC 50818 / BSB-021) TaxID=946362 RepID=F2U8U0_SALR5|nr:uncharacterized protein PTSG_04525 [Salpingoeca rosetta]EGD72798.1 hypothetical protein PTSG_04525 [Salpingoeca rosetta]|eukprot:XP_004994621.1 hypothetical protein PTSG_04525 [Salpingoeca rosetta]